MLVFNMALNFTFVCNPKNLLIETIDVLFLLIVWNYNIFQILGVMNKNIQVQHPCCLVPIL
jgi:hypothetical protein